MKGPHPSMDPLERERERERGLGANGACFACSAPDLLGELRSPLPPPSMMLEM